MIILIEALVFCIVFTLMILILSKDPIKTLYNYPPKIQERVKSLDEYKGQIPTQNNKIATKILAAIIIIIIASVVMRFINEYTDFLTGFKYSYLLWTIVNWYDALIMDCLWFCHDKRFIFKGTEDMKKDYHDYWFHIKGAIIGQIIGLGACLAIGGVVGLI